MLVAAAGEIDRPNDTSEPPRIFGSWPFLYVKGMCLKKVEGWMSGLGVVFRYVWV